MDEKTYRSLRRIVEYLYADEQRDFLASEDKKDHIFHDIMRVDGWTEEVAKDYEVYAR